MSEIPNTAKEVRFTCKTSQEINSETFVYSDIPNSSMYINIGAYYYSASAYGYFGLQINKQADTVSASYIRNGSSNPATCNIYYR